MAKMTIMSKELLAEKITEETIIMLERHYPGFKEVFRVHDNLYQIVLKNLVLEGQDAVDLTKKGEKELIGLDYPAY